MLGLNAYVPLVVIGHYQQPAPVIAVMMPLTTVMLEITVPAEQLALEISAIVPVAAGIVRV